jgi:hypothetical protein
VRLTVAPGVPLDGRARAHEPAPRGLSYFAPVRTSELAHYAAVTVAQCAGRGRMGRVTPLQQLVWIVAGNLCGSRGIVCPLRTRVDTSLLCCLPLS